LTISAHPKSTARILRIRVKYFIVGKEYDIYFIVKNIGDETSPPGECYIFIKWPGTETGSRWHFNFDSLEPGMCHKSNIRTYPVLSPGVATITVRSEDPRKGVPSKNNPVFYRKDGESRQPPGEAIELIVAQMPEAIHEYLALIVAVISLGIIALEKIIQALRFLSIIPF